MLIINEDYAIKNDGLCYAICKRPKFNPEKPDVVREYTAKWYLNTLSQAICFLIDRAIEIPYDLKILSDNIESFKNDIQGSLRDSVLDAETKKGHKDRGK